MWDSTSAALAAANAAGARRAPAAARSMAINASGATAYASIAGGSPFTWTSTR